MESAGIVAQQAMTQMKLAMEAVKSSAQAEKNIANMIDEVARNAPGPSSGRGSVLDILA